MKDTTIRERKLHRWHQGLKKPLIIILSLVVVLGSYLAYHNFMASASVSGTKNLTANGSAVNASVTVIDGGSFSDTHASNNTRFRIRETVRAVGNLGWNFTGWTALNTSTEATGPKVTKVVVHMEANCTRATDTSNPGDKTFIFSMYNYETGNYDLNTTSSRRLNSTTDVTFSLEFPDDSDYTNYFDASGNFRIQMMDIAEAQQSQIRIDRFYVVIYYDKTAPTVSWHSPSGPLYTNAAEVVLRASGTDNSDAEQTGISRMSFYHNSDTQIGYSNSPETGSTNNGTWAYAWKPKEGTYSVYARARDGKYNISSNTAAQTIVVDRTPPILNLEYYADSALTQALPISGGKAFAKAGTVYVKLAANETLRSNANDNQITIDAPGTANDVTSVNFTWNGSAWVYNWTVGSGNDGDTVSITVKGTDLAGNVYTGVPASGGTVRIDTVQPVLSLQYYADAELTVPVNYYESKPIVGIGNLYVKLISNETLSPEAGAHKITIDAPGTLNDVTNQNFLWDAEVNAWLYAWNVSTGNDGDTISISVSGKDVAGNTRSGAPSSGGTVSIDTVLPNAAITAPTAGAVIKGTYNIQGTASDAKALDYYRVEYRPTESQEWTQIGSDRTVPVTGGTLLSWDTTSVPDGYYEIRLTVCDKAMNSATVMVGLINIDNIAPIMGLEYYKDPELTQPIPLFQGKPSIKAGTVYIKLVPDEVLRDNPGDNQISINAPGTNNDVSNANFVWTGSAWRYTWNVVSDTDGDTSSITVKGTSLTGNVRTAAPIFGGTVTIDNTIKTPSLTYMIDSETLILEWSIEPDHSMYYIYRSEEDGFIPGEDNLLATAYAPNETYLAVYSPGTYYYKLKAQDIAGNISQSSAQIKVYKENAATGAYLRYFNTGPDSVAISVYWDDNQGGSTVQWANDMIGSGEKLDWHIANLTFSGFGTSKAYATLSGAEKYKNYYFRLNKGGQTSIIRAYPVDFDSGLGPRYQNDYAHGNFQPDTAMCAACHSTHSGLKAQLLVQATYYELCLLCHGTAASQSKYDVQSGKVRTADGWKNSLAGPIGTDYGTSKHNVDDRASVSTTVYGSAPGKILTFTCASCHKAHGGTNDNYRLLRDTIYPADDKFTSTDVYYNAYAIVRDQAVGEELYMVSGNTEFCSACHMDYAFGTAKHQDGIYSSYYRHPVTVGEQVYSVYRSDPLKDLYPKTEHKLPLQYSASADSKSTDKRTAVVCSTCHYAHGTYKNFNVGYPQANGLPRITVTNQKMLRLDNYGVCESCHKKSMN